MHKLASLGGPFSALDSTQAYTANSKSLSSHTTSNNLSDRIFITHIHAANVISGLRHRPAGLHVTIENNGEITRTSKRPVLVGGNGAEWDEEILLLPELSSTISFKLYASFELKPNFGNGVLLCRFKTTVGNILKRDEELQPIRFLVQRDENVSSRSSLRIVAERRIYEVNESAAALSLPVSDTIRLAQLSDSAHRALRHYRQLRSQRDLDEAIAYLERARDMCTVDHPDRSTILFDLATAMFTHCQDNCHYHDLNVPIALYHDALWLGSSNRPHRCMTALDLCFALLARLQSEGGESGGMKTRNLNYRVVESYAYRVAWTALQMAGLTVSNRMIRSRSSPALSMDLRIGELIEKARVMLRGLSDRTPRRAEVLADLGSLLCHRFEGGSGLVDIHESISMLEEAIQFTPDTHPDKPDRLSRLGTSLCHRFEHLGNFGDIQKSILAFEEAVHLTPNRHPGQLANLNNLGISLSRRFERFGDLADLSKSILVFEQAVHFTPNHDPDKASRLNNLGSSLSNRFQRTGDLADINKAISMFEQAAHLTPTGDPSRPGHLSNLGSSLYRRFERLDDLADINKSVSMGEEAVRLAPSGHPNKPSWLTHLGSSLNLRFQRLGHLADINKSISTLEEAVRLTPNDHPNKQTRLDYLGISLCHRFGRLGDNIDMNRSISVLEEAVRLIPSDHPSKPARLNNLGSSLVDRFERLGDIADINKSISLREKAVSLTPDNHPHKPAWLNGLGSSLLCRFERLGDVTDLDKSISVKERAISLTPNEHADKPAWLDTLAASLCRRFERLGDLTDLCNSISMQEEAICLTPSDHFDKPGRLNRLGISLLLRFERLGNLTDINKSISILEEAVCLTPNNHSNRSTWLLSLGTSLLRRFEQLGNLADINQSISTFEEATHVTPSDHPGRPAQLSSLASSLLSRFHHLGDLTDMEKSVVLLEEAVYHTPINHPDRPSRLSNLASSLFHRFGHFSDLADLDRSVLLSEEADHLTPAGSPEKPARLGNLGCILSRRFERFDDPADIYKSILMLEDAVRLTPDSHPDKSGWLNNLGVSLLRRFEHLGDPADINMSIFIQEDAVRLTPNDHPDKLARLTNLGNTFMKCYEHSYDPSNLSAATQHFSEASRASTGPASIRFASARRWISSARLQGDTQAALDAYATIIDLLPRLAWMGLSLADRHRLIFQAAHIVRDAAATALDAGHPDKAVEWLEQGRSIVWSQFLQLRTPVDELSVEHPVLARQFQQISRELERASSREHSLSLGFVNNSVASARPLEQGVQSHHDLALRREKLLSEIRSLPGFDRFLLPKTIEQLASMTYSGPVVYLNASEQRCDALIITANTPNAIVVPLTGIHFRELVWFHGLVHLLLTQERLISRDDILASIPSDKDFPSRQFLDSLLVGNSNVEDADRGARVKPLQTVGYTTDDLFRKTLAYLWSNVVYPVLEALGILDPMPSSVKNNRIFWCPTGPFAFLPIHAAGLYCPDGTGAKLSDFAISSYVPSLSALALSIRKGTGHPQSHIRLLAVPQPETDGLNALVCVREEVDHLRNLSAQSPFVTFEDSKDGTVEDVLEKMKHADWVHFACHGVQDSEDPLSSGLCLADHRRLKLSDVIQLSRPQGGLAFLSACQTAQGDVKLADESVHIAAGMLLAGYGSVVATMWAIRDPDAPQVTRSVYEHLFRDGKVPDSTETAEALHDAVQHLRDSGASFTAWVPFIHVGR